MMFIDVESRKEVFTLPNDVGESGSMGSGRVSHYQTVHATNKSRVDRSLDEGDCVCYDDKSTGEYAGTSNACDCATDY